MAVAVLMDFAGVGTADYDAVMRTMRFDGRLPLGGLFHGAGAGPRGLQVRDVWETPEAFERYAVARLQPVTELLGLPRPEVRLLPVEEIRRGTAAPVRSMRFCERTVAPAPRDDSVLLATGPCPNGWFALEFLATHRDPADTPVHNALAGTPVTA